MKEINNPELHIELKHFIRKTLGCDCPDEVFKSITVQRLPAQANLAADYSIDVGSRLLIFLTWASQHKLTADAMQQTCVTGRNVRDHQSFNRFRFVLITADQNPLASDALASIDTLLSSDDKLHFHLVQVSDLTPAIARMDPNLLS